MKIRPNIAELAPYVPGKPIEELERELGVPEVIKLASNENPLGPSEKVVEAVRAAAAHLHRYPDGSAHNLRGAVAARHGVKPAQIVFGNGSNDVLEIIARTLLAPGDEVVFSEYAFVVYRLASQAVGADIVEVPAGKDYAHDLDAMAEAITQKTRIVFLANPNNPTGTMFGKEAWERFLKRVPEQTLILYDEAYAEYVTDDDYPDPWKALKDGRNLMITRTFSKIFGMAALRLGYGVTSAELADYCNRVRQPFNVNALAQAGGLAALEDEDYVRRSRELNTRGLHYLGEHLRRRGFELIPSWGNFITAIWRHPARPLYDALLRRGVIVRPMGGYGMPNAIRVSVGTTEELIFFDKALGGALEDLG